MLTVLEWACNGGEGRLPQIARHDLGALYRPTAQLREALGRLAAVTAARLLLGAPPLGDDAPISCDGLVIAAAIGLVAQQGLPRALLEELRPASHFAEAVVRHGLVVRALPLLSQVIADDLRVLSPLTAVIERPAPGTDGDVFAAAERLRAVAAGRRLLVVTLSEPTDSSAIRKWRTDLLARWRGGTEADVELVLDIYEAAIVHHEATFLEQIRAARAVIADPKAVQNDDLTETAISVAKWWEPLSRIERANVSLVRDRRYLGYEYRKGLDFYRYTRRMTGEVA